MNKDCERFRADITDYARGESKYVKDMDALLTHLKECAECRQKYFDLEAIFDGLKEAYYQPSPEFLKRMEEIKAIAKKGLPPQKELTEEQKKMKQGIELYKSRKWFEAAKVFDNLIKQLEGQIPLSPPLTKGDGGILADAYYHLGLVHQKMNLTGEALVNFNKAIELNQDAERSGVPTDVGNADAYYHRAEVKYDLAPWGDEDDMKAMLKETIKDLSQAIYLNPDYIEAYYGRAMVYDALGEFETAIDAFSEVIEHDPKNYLAYLYRGNVSIKMDLLKQAQRDFRKAIELAPDFYIAYHNLGIAYAIEGDFKQAVAEFKAALKINPEYQPAKEALRMAEEKIKLDELKAKIMEKIAEAEEKFKDKKKVKTKYKDEIKVEKFKERIKELETENKMLKEFNQKLMATIGGHGQTAYQLQSHLPARQAISPITPLPLFIKRECVAFSPKKMIQ